LKGIEGVVYSRKVARNTVLFRLQDGTECLKYHDTIVVKKSPDGTTTLNSGGFRTMTTKERIREFAHVYISQKNNVWYMSDGSAFYDGVVVKTKTPGETYQGKTVILSKVRPVNETAVKQMRARIAKYVALITPTNLPHPSSGDCWYCSMTEVRTGRPMGELGPDYTHLITHMKEGYIVGSLIVNALKESGHPPTAWGFMYHEAALNKSGKNYNLQDIRRAVSKYLQKRLLPGVMVR
jgi:hypothetical protein